MLSTRDGLTGLASSRKLSAILALAALSSLSVVRDASGFGLRSHLWIGQQVVQEIQSQCAVKIAGLETTIPLDVCDSIRRHPGVFLAGVLGPDAFPDIIAGQVTTHPGIEGDWQTSEWLVHIYGRARAGEELAFAAGYLVHAATDMFAHSYVNGYSGDVFVLSDERAVEQRHFVLEKYIDFHLPPGEPDPSSLEVPAEFLRDRLLYNEDAARLARKSGVALHIPAMYAVRISVGELERQLESLERDAGKFLAELVVRHIELAAQVATGEAQLKFAEEALRVHEQALALVLDALDKAKAIFDAAGDMVERNKELINLSALQAKAARVAADAARDAGLAASKSLADVETKLADLRAEIAKTPSEIDKEVCDWVTGACRRICPIPYVCDIICGPSEWVCKVKRVVNDVWQKLVDNVTELDKKRINFEREVRDKGAEITAQLVKEAAALKAKAEAEALRAGLEIVRAGAEAGYRVAKTRYEVELTATTKAREGVAALRAKIGDLRSKLIDLERIKQAIADLVDRANILSFFAHNWRKGLDVAGIELMRTGVDVARILATGSGGILPTYARWVQCYGSAFTPVPYQLGEFGCKAEDFYRRIDTEVDRLIERVLPEPFAGLYRRYRAIKDHINGELHDQTENAAVQVLKLASPDRSTGEFIELLVRPENATESRLNSVYQTVGDADGKKLLVFDDAVQHFKQDFGWSGGGIDTQRFAAFRHASTASRLALLDPTSLRTLVWRLGGDPANLRLRATGDRFSVLYQSLRSIDGNHQWQPFGLPYPRTSGQPEPVSAQQRRYGYGPSDGASYGFPLFVDPTLRSIVFPQLFPAPISGQLAKRPELRPAVYPFPECPANPFPVAFNDDGTPRERDHGCDGGNAARPLGGKPRFRKAWRGFLYWIGYKPFPK